MSTGLKLTKSLDTYDQSTIRASSHVNNDNSNTHRNYGYYNVNQPEEVDNEFPFEVEEVASVTFHCVRGLPYRDDVCPYEVHCPKHPSESEYLHNFAHHILREGPRDCFPIRSHHLFVHGDIYDPCKRPINPGTFANAEFRTLWQREPVHIYVAKSKMREEENYRGIVWRLLWDPDDFPSEESIERGTIIIINGYSSKSTKYIATIRRHIDFDHSFVQLNAFTDDQRMLEYDNPVWPTVILRVPNSQCRVPIPRIIVPYFAEYITQPSRLLSIWNSIKRIWNPKSTEIRREVDVLDD